MSYQNLILGNGNSKPNQVLNIKSLIADTIECVDLDVQNVISSQQDITTLFVTNINAEIPATEITINDKVMILNDLEVIGNIIGNISDDIIDVNEINQKDNGFIQMNDDTVITSQSLKLTSVAGQNLISAPNCLHLQSNGDACFYLQAGRDGGLADNPLMWSKSNNGLNGSYMGVSNNQGAFQIASGNSTDNTSGRIQLFTANITDNGDNAPGFGMGSIMLADFNETEAEIFRDVNIHTNSLKEVEAIDANNINASTDIDIKMNDDVVVNGSLSVIDNTNVIDFQENLITSYAGLNMNENNIFNISSIDCDTLKSNTFSKIDVLDDLDLGTKSLLNVGDISVGGLATLTATALDNAATNILVLDGTSVKYKQESSIKTFNTYGQSIVAGTFTTASLMYVPGPNVLVFNPMPLGKYILNWSALIGNTNRNTETWIKITFIQSGFADVIVDEATKANMDVNSTGMMASGFTVIDNVNNVNSSFTVSYRAGGTTAILTNPRIAVYRINV